MKIQLPEHVKQIIHRLQQEGYDAYAVGDASGIPFWGDVRRIGISQLQ